jgi:hypothetical protein
VVATSPSDPSRRTAPLSWSEVLLLPTRPSLPETVKVRSPFRSFATILTPNSLLVPSAYTCCRPKLTSTFWREPLNVARVPLIVSTIAPGSDFWTAAGGGGVSRGFS